MKWVLFLGIATLPFTYHHSIAMQLDSTEYEEATEYVYRTCVICSKKATLSTMNQISVLHLTYFWCREHQCLYCNRSSVDVEKGNFVSLCQKNDGSFYMCCNRCSKNKNLPWSEFV